MRVLFLDFYKAPDKYVSNFYYLVGDPVLVAFAKSKLDLPKEIKVIDILHKAKKVKFDEKTFCSEIEQGGQFYVKNWHRMPGAKRRVRKYMANLACVPGNLIVLESFTEEQVLMKFAEAFCGFGIVIDCSFMNVSKRNFVWGLVRMFNLEPGVGVIDFLCSIFSAKIGELFKFMSLLEGVGKLELDELRNFVVVDYSFERTFRKFINNDPVFNKEIWDLFNKHDARRVLGAFLAYTISLIRSLEGSTYAKSWLASGVTIEKDLVYKLFYFMVSLYILDVSNLRAWYSMLNFWRIVKEV